MLCEKVVWTGVEQAGILTATRAWMKTIRKTISGWKSVGLERKGGWLYRSGKCNRSALKAFALVAVLVAIGAILTKSRFYLPCTLLNGAATLTIKLGELDPGTVRAFCYRDPTGQKLRFLLARDSNGKVQTVFDACEQCYKFHKGYSYSGGYLICRLCGNRYPIPQIKAGKASCVPVPLSSKTEHGEARIKVADVKAGKWLF
jgi:uncharacterized membrane protein